MEFAQAGEVVPGGGRHLRRLGAGLFRDNSHLCGDLLGGAGGLQQAA